MNEIFTIDQFKPLKNLENYNLNFPGVYALAIKNIKVLPVELRDEVKMFKSQIIYIGKASQNLGNRLEEECRGKRHGTFFRSIGALLNLRPPAGSLVGKANCNNYKFDSRDCKNIITWMNENLLFDFLEVKKNINYIEKDLIKHFHPLLNINHNPSKSNYLMEARKECREIAVKKFDRE
jgi:hypothetical protein